MVNKTCQVLLVLSVIAFCLQSVCGENDTNYFDIRITLARIPKVQTYYVCQQFKVPDNEAYHAVSFEPQISNRDAVHHMLVFGCDFKMESSGPHPCDRIDNRCRTWLVKYDVGMDGEMTMPAQAGVRFGKNSFSYMLLQVHWNNPELSENMTDDSGMRVRYTNKLRQFDIGNFQTGQNQLEIPAESRDVVVSGSCSSTCTSMMLPHPINITSVYLHMHELGDEIRLSCIYNSMDGQRHRNHSTTWGQGSNSEMCYAFIRYYPHIRGLDQCIQVGDQDVNCRERTL